MGALVLDSSSRLLPDLAPNINWIQKIGAQINSIRDAPYLEPSFICLSKFLVNQPPPGCPTGASL